MRTFALLAILTSALFSTACLDSDPNAATDDQADYAAREFNELPRQLPSALHDEPLTDTVTDWQAADRDGTLGQTDPGTSMEDTGVANPEGTVGSLPCRPIEQRPSPAGEQPAPTAYEIGQRARARMHGFSNGHVPKFGPKRSL